MVRSAESVVIARAPSEAFSYVADLRNEPAWRRDVAAFVANLKRVLET